MDGYTRIKNLYLEGTCRDDSLKRIVTFLMKRPNMNDNYLNEEKNLVDMMKFLYEKARAKANNNVACLADEEVYDLVVSYFTKSNEELEFNKPIPKVNVKPPVKEEVKNDNQLSLELECT
ncbi:MAG: hypothetical protein HFF38_13090 [Lawsonibacter sp.]|jgi:Tfp pilus assembly PilM family ATPase|nr:hypothetical protein [Lawsonibacter sp.]